MTQHPRILIVERDAIAGRALCETLAEQGYGVELVGSGEDAFAALERSDNRPIDERFGVVIADQDSAGSEQGVGLVRRLHRDRPTVVPILVSAFRKVEAAVQAMRLGAADYLLKPIAEAELLDAIQRATQRHLLRTERETKQQPVAESAPSASAAAGHALPRANQPWEPMALSEAMKGPERAILLTALEANDWSRQRTAEQLQINRTTLYKKIRQYRLDEPA